MQTITQEKPPNNTNNTNILPPIQAKQLFKIPENIRSKSKNIHNAVKTDLRIATNILGLTAVILFLRSAINNLLEQIDPNGSIVKTIFEILPIIIIFSVIFSVFAIFYNLRKMPINKFVGKIVFFLIPFILIFMTFGMLFFAARGMDVDIFDMNMSLLGIVFSMYLLTEINNILKIKELGLKSKTIFTKFRKQSLKQFRVLLRKTKQIKFSDAKRIITYFKTELFFIILFSFTLVIRPIAISILGDGIVSILFLLPLTIVLSYLGYKNIKNLFKVPSVETNNANTDTSHIFLDWYRNVEKVVTLFYILIISSIVFTQTNIISLWNGFAFLGYFFWLLVILVPPALAHRGRPENNALNWFFIPLRFIIEIALVYTLIGLEYALIVFLFSLPVILTRNYLHKRMFPDSFAILGKQYVDRIPRSFPYNKTTHPHLQFLSTRFYNILIKINHPAIDVFLLSRSRLLSQKHLATLAERIVWNEEIDVATISSYSTYLKKTDTTLVSGKRWAIAQNPNTPKNILDNIANISTESPILQKVADNPNTSVESKMIAVLRISQDYSIKERKNIFPLFDIYYDITGRWKLKELV